jgi:hypothetical protein
MRIFFMIFAAIVVALLTRIHGHTLTIDIVVWAILGLWVAALVFAILRPQGWRWVALAALAPLISELLHRTSRYIAFIVEHGGMDCGACNGSPLAFLLDWTMELFLLIPGLFLCTWLARLKQR